MATASAQAGVTLNPQCLPQSAAQANSVAFAQVTGGAPASQANANAQANAVAGPGGWAQANSNAVAVAMG